ncbi:MAG: hypothetical protein OXN21_01995 [Chloroflexota bacterium]|nr:hypothetical protein [Chloroflexota bacterium]
MLSSFPGSRIFLLLVILVGTTILGGAAFLTAPEALANGKATLIDTQEQGPYRFEVSILPSRAIVNNTHLSLRVIALETEETLTAAAVRVSADGPHLGNEFGPIIADNDVLPQFFETTLPFSAPGLWQVRINVTTELGDETISVPMDVREGRPINLILVAAIAVAVIAVGIWTYDRIRSGIRRRRANG